jgi:hypothetical protein
MIYWRRRMHAHISMNDGHARVNTPPLLHESGGKSSRVRAMSVYPRTTRTRAGIDVQQSGHDPSFSVQFNDPQHRSPAQRRQTTFTQPMADVNSSIP